MEKNILLDSLNKKILFLAGAVFLISFFLQAFMQNPQNYHSKVYMHESEKEDVQIDLNSMEKEVVEDIDIMFLPVEEVERVLNRTKFEKLYVNNDPNFQTKVENIENYLGRRNAPLAKEAEYIVMMSNKFGIDYRIVVAISIIESSGGIHTYRPYNAWGWGGAEGFTFENWEHSIYVVSRGIAGYYSRGQDTPEKMAPTYNPHTPEEWGPKVRMVMNRIGQEL